jgi:hypothetical protein
VIHSFGKKWILALIAGDLSLTGNIYIRNSSFGSNFGRLVSRGGLENLLDNYPHSPPMDSDAPIHDIWLSKVFVALRDINQKPFFPPPGDEGRVVFCLVVDGFNPFHVKASGISASSTGIWLVCP